MREKSEIDVLRDKVLRGLDTSKINLLTEADKKTLDNLKERRYNQVFLLDIISILHKMDIDLKIKLVK